MAGIGMLFDYILKLGVVITGLVYMVHPATGKEIVRRVGMVALAVFAANQALSYLWSNGIGRLLLIGLIVFVFSQGCRKK